MLEGQISLAAQCEKTCPLTDSPVALSLWGLEETVFAGPVLPSLYS